MVNSCCLCPLLSPVLLKRTLVCTILLFSSISFYCSLKKAIFSLLVILWNSTFSWVYLFLSPLLLLLCFLLLFFFQLFVSPPQTATLPSCISFHWGWFLSLPPGQCYEPPPILFQALRLPDLIP